MSNQRRLGLLARGWDGRSLAIPFVDPAVGVLVFAAASLLKDTVNRIGDLVDDGVPNQSFEGCAVRCHCGSLHRGS